MYDQNERIVGSNEQINDKYKEMTIRPKWLKDYIGQDKAKEKLKIFIESSKKEKKLLTMFYCKVLQDLVRQPFQI